MTDNKIIKALECLRGNAFDCGECPYCSCYPAPCEQQVAKDALSLINRQKEEVKKLQVFKSYFDELYGAGLDIANYHLNGELESFDNFYESALQEMVGDNNA